MQTFRGASAPWSKNKDVHVTVADEFLMWRWMCEAAVAKCQKTAHILNTASFHVILK